MASAWVSDGPSSGVYLALYAGKTLLPEAKHLVTWDPRNTGSLALTERRLGRVPLPLRDPEFNSLSQSPQSFSSEAPISVPLRLKWRGRLSNFSAFPLRPHLPKCTLRAAGGVVDSTTGLALLFGGPPDALRTIRLFACRTLRARAWTPRSAQICFVAPTPPPQHLTWPPPVGSTTHKLSLQSDRKERRAA